jgi:transcriptional regulator with XRE-family HTH domain/tetratricopeptide (TPR) repeat protein
MAGSFGTVLRDHRLAASLTQEALAERAAMSATAIAALERGRRSPRLSTIRQLAKALDLDSDQLAVLSRAASVRDEGAPAAEPLDLAPPRDSAAVRAEPAPHTPAAARTAPLPAVIDRRWRTRFVGRTTEFDALRRAWSRRDRFVPVVGEAGIGKTRLVAELACTLHEAEAVTIGWGRSSEEPLGAFAPWVELLRPLVAYGDRDTLARALADCGEIARLLPEIDTVIGPLPPPVRADESTEQRRLFEAVAAVLMAVAPALVVLDDLHWADDATIALLAFLVRDSTLRNVVFVVTAREHELDQRVAGRLSDAARHAAMSRVHVTGLDDVALAALVADVAGAPPDAQALTSIRGTTDGNPFFVEELTLHLIDSGVVVDEGAHVALRAAANVGVPERVRETVARRLMSLPKDTTDLLAAGAVIGREFEVPLALEASGLDGVHLVDAVDDALLSGLVLEAGPGALSFAHALVRDGVTESFSMTRRAAIHRRVAEALERSTAYHELPAARLAHHWTAAATIDPSVSATAAMWSVRAGDAALASAAADEAIARYAEASALWERTTYGHADALVRLGVALQRRGRADEADARFREATHLALALADAELQARAAIGLGARYPFWEIDPERVDALEAALSALPDDDLQFRPTLMAMLVAQLVLGFSPEQARRRDELAAAVCEIVVDPKTSAATLLQLGDARIYNCIEDAATLDRVARTLARVADEANDLRVLAAARFAQALSALDQADMPELRTAVDHYGEIAERVVESRERAQAAMMRATIALIHGDYDDAAVKSEAALEFGRAAGDPNAELVGYAQGLLRAVDLGQARDVLPLLLATDDYSAIASFAAGTALIAAFAGEHDVAAEGVARFVADGLAGLPRGADWLAPVAFLAHTCSLIGGVEHAPVLLDALETPDRTVRVGPLIGWWGPVAHHRGTLLALCGRYDEALAQLHTALEIEVRMDARPFVARTHAAIAGVVARIESPQSAACTSAATQARATAKSLGAPGVSEEVEGLLARAGL